MDQRLGKPLVFHMEGTFDISCATIHIYLPHDIHYNTKEHSQTDFHNIEGLIMGI